MNASPARVLGLQRVNFGVLDVAESAAFYEDKVRFVPRGAEGDRVIFGFGAGESQLQLERSPTPGMKGFAFSVADAELDAIVERAAAAGIPIVVHPTAGVGPGERRFARLLDPDENVVDLVVAHDGANVPRAAPTVARKLGHIVLWTPDIARMEAFFEVLGMRVCDRTHLGMSFLRCNDDHHTIGLALSSSGRTGMQHAAFDVGTEQAVDHESARLAGSGVRCIWGPGRHGPGNNIFSYYFDPSKNIFELYGDMQRVPTDRSEIGVRYWGTEHRGDISGKAGPPPAEFRS
jgi:catechol 2,3-dioxygenase-like lactoylglutathione lyase family enzyme